MLFVRHAATGEHKTIIVIDISTGDSPGTCSEQDLFLFGCQSSGCLYTAGEDASNEQEAWGATLPEWFIDSHERQSKSMGGGPAFGNDK